MEKSNKVYIYDLQKIYFYILHGIKPIEAPRKNLKSNKVFFVFDYKETEEIYKEWIKYKYGEN